MDILIEAHKKMLLLFIEHQVEFLLVGGYAVILYGYERGTGDMDIWVRPDNTNRDKFIKALRAYGINEMDLEKLGQMDFTGDARVMQIGEKPAQIDFLTRVQGVLFEEAYPVKKLVPLKDLQLPVIHFDHLIVAKMLAGRTKDLADVEELQNIQKFRKNL